MASFGALAFLTVSMFVKKSVPMAVQKGDTRKGVKRAISIDWIGTILVLGMVTCLTLATTWGANTKGWGSPAVIAVRKTVSVSFNENMLMEN